MLLSSQRYIFGAFLSHVLAEILAFEWVLAVWLMCDNKDEEFSGFLS